MGEHALAVAPRRRPIKRRRVLIADARADGRYLRVTWHAEEQTFVLSTWSDEVCSGAIRIPVDRAPELINLLSDGVGDALTAKAAAPPAARGQLHEVRQEVRRTADRFTTWLRGAVRK
jgi:hypothetical protein